jgi:hypothetical protein
MQVALAKIMPSIFMPTKKHLYNQRLTAEKKPLKSRT